MENQRKPREGENDELVEKRIRAQFREFKSFLKWKRSKKLVRTKGDLSSSSFWFGTCFLPCMKQSF